MKVLLEEVGLEAQLTGANLFSCCALIAFDCVPATWADSTRESYSTYGKFPPQYIMPFGMWLGLGAAPAGRRWLEWMWMRLWGELVPSCLTWAMWGAIPLFWLCDSSCAFGVGLWFGPPPIARHYSISLYTWAWYWGATEMSRCLASKGAVAVLWGKTGSWEQMRAQFLFNRPQWWSTRYLRGCPFYWSGSWCGSPYQNSKVSWFRLG